MKIITWNINGYRSITGQNPSKRYNEITKENKLFSYIEKENPDIICLQEIKADVEQINSDLLAPANYNYYYNTATSKKGYSGVAVFCKQKPNSINTKLGNELFDSEGRLLELFFDDFILYNIYFPKGYADNERLYFKLDFYETFFLSIQKHIDSNKKIIIVGDYNTAHKEIDLARPKENIQTSGFMEIEREKLDKLVSLGFADAFRLKNQDTGHYSWWSQRGRARENNIGWRIDYIFISNILSNLVDDTVIQSQVIGSDHCPVVMNINL